MGGDLNPPCQVEDIVSPINFDLTGAEAPYSPRSNGAIVKRRAGVIYGKSSESSPTKAQKGAKPADPGDAGLKELAFPRPDEYKGFDTDKNGRLSVKSEQRRC